MNKHSLTWSRKQILIWYYWGIDRSTSTLSQICTGGIHSVYACNLHTFLKIEMFDESDVACSHGTNKCMRKLGWEYENVFAWGPLPWDLLYIKPENIVLWVSNHELLNDAMPTYCMGIYHQRKTACLLGRTWTNAEHCHWYPRTGAGCSLC